MHFRPPFPRKRKRRSCPAASIAQIFSSEFPSQRELHVLIDFMTRSMQQLRLSFSASTSKSYRPARRIHNARIHAVLRVDAGEVHLRECLTLT